MSQPIQEISASPMSGSKRFRASGPILLLAILFLAATFLAWYFTWFGRGLSDGDITKYLEDTRNPRHVQHALLQVQQRLERGDQSAKTWYAQIQALSENPETEFRLTTAWLMGFDNKSNEFHSALLKLVHDPEPIVRRNAALALVRFGDKSGHDELLSVLRPYSVRATATGTVSSTLRAGSDVSRGTLLIRVQGSDGREVEIRSPLPGKINQLSKVNGEVVNTNDELLTLNSDEESVWEALRGLSLIGTAADTDFIFAFMKSTNLTPRVKEQGLSTMQTLGTRK